MPQFEQKDKVEAPVSQKTPPNTGTTDKPDLDSPKLESTGVTKNSKGNTVEASESINKTGVITGDKSSSSYSNQPFEKSFSSIEGEILGGDSFRITLQRGNKTIRIPVPVEGSNNVVILDNTFRIIKEVLKVSTEKELNEKFAAFVE